MLSSAESERLEADRLPVRPPAPAPPPGNRLPLLGLPALTLAVGLAVTLGLVLLAESQYHADQDRLLKLRLRDAATLFTGALPAEQATLAAAAELANATHGNVHRFMEFRAPNTAGARPRFTSLSLWRLDRLGSGPVAVLGTAPELTPADAGGLFARAARQHTLGVVGLLSAPRPAVGYAFVTGGYAAYAENPLPAGRRSPLPPSSAFYGLDYAIYLGPRQAPGQLLATNVAHLPLPSPSASQRIAFGDSTLLLAMSSRIPLPGTLPRDLPWIIAGLGFLLSASAAAMTLRLNQRREAAEQLAAKVGRMAEEQRTIAQTLQHALLPDVLPQGPRLQASARYVPGERGVDVGGDWYDVIELDGERLLLVVGDVSGRGLQAATTMASLRYAIRAYATQGDCPTEILAKLSRLVDVGAGGQLATILCALIDADQGTIAVTSAGHLPPLLIGEEGAHYLTGPVGVPIGVQEEAPYVEERVPLPPSGTLVACTDGLVEVRGESIDDGLERLRQASIRGDEQLADLVDRLVAEVPDAESHDDIAIVGVRWRT